MKTVVSSLFLEEHLNTVKLATLYCDQIILPDTGSGLMALLTEPDESNIATGLSVASWSTISDDIKKNLKSLIDEQILVLSEERQHIEQGTFFDTFDDVQDRLFRKDPSTGNLLNRYDEIGLVALGRSPSVQFLENEFEKYYSLYDLVQGYFSFLAEVAMSEAIHHNSPILTDSQVVNELLLNFLTTERLNKRYNLAEQKSVFLTHQVMQEFLPNVKDAPIDEILNVRYKLRDELEAFRFAMAKLSTDINSNPWEAEVENEVDRIIETKVKPSVYDLKMALRHSNSQTLQRAFDNLKDPTTYVPLIGTVLSGIQPSIAILVSMGFASFRALYDTFIERRKVQDSSGLVFLLKAPKKLRGNHRKR